MQFQELSKQKEKYIKSLSFNKFRQKYGKFTVEGRKLFDEIIQKKPLEIEFLLATKDWLAENMPSLTIEHSKIICIEAQKFKELSNLTTPQNPILVVNQSESKDWNELKSTGWYIYVDRLQDPGNMGTIIRIAEWFGVQAVIKSKGSVDFYNTKVVQASMGSIFRVPLYTSSFLELKSHLRGLPCIVTSLDGDNMYNLNIPKSGGIIVVGNESSGVEHDIENECDISLKIPAAPTSQAESLNAAMATGIVCSYLCR